MIRHWMDVELEASKLASLINKGTDQELVNYLRSLSPEYLRSSITHISKQGDTAVHLAAIRERLASVRVMLNSQADSNTRDGHGRSPLHACLCHNSLSSARLLISFGADVNETVCRQTRESLLHRMIKANRPLAVELLLELGSTLKAVTKDGDTPLHFAARYNRLKMARFLSVMGADVNAANLRQETPLHTAIASRSLDVAQALVKNKVSVTVKDSQGMTSLHSAVLAGNVELVRLILNSNSTQVNTKESVLGRTPLLLACSTSNHKIVALLLSYGADVTLTTHYRKSVLHEAATSGTCKVLSTIMKRTDNPNLLATNNQTPLHCAVVGGHANIVRILLDAGANINMKDMDGNTALHMAAQAGNNHIISVLIQHGSQVNLTNLLQQTALHLSSKAGHASTCSMLIKAGCDPDSLDLQQAKASSYLDKFVGRSDRNIHKETGIKRGLTTVRFCDPSKSHLQEIQERIVGEDRMEQNLLHPRDNRSVGHKGLYVFGSTTAHVTLTNDLECNKPAEDLMIAGDRQTNGTSITCELQTGAGDRQTHDTSITCELQPMAGTKSGSDQESSRDEKIRCQTREITHTRYRKSRTIISNSKNNATKGMHDHFRAHGDNDELGKQEDIDQRKRKQGVVV